MPDSETPIQDALDSAFRKHRGLDAPEPERSPEEVAAANRKAAEARLTNAESRSERREKSQHFVKVRRALHASMDRLPHGTRLSADDVGKMVDRILKEIGGNTAVAREAVTNYVKVTAAALADGDKSPQETGSYAIAEEIINAGWTPSALPDDDDDDLGPAELADRIAR